MAPGINGPKDFLKAKGFKFGGLRATATHDLKGRLSLDLLIGAKNYKTVTGYRGFTPIFAAIHQNDQWNIRKHGVPRGIEFGLAFMITTSFNNEFTLGKKNIGDFDS